MSSYEADEDSTDREFYHNNKPVIVASDIEDVVLVADIVRRRKILAYI